MPVKNLIQNTVQPPQYSPQQQSPPPFTGTKEREELNKRFKLYRESCKRQGVKPLAFDLWWKAGAPSVPAEAQELPPSPAELEQQKKKRAEGYVDALGNIVYYDKGIVEVNEKGKGTISLDEYINDITQQLNAYNSATSQELADPIVQQDISNLQKMLQDVGVTPPKITPRTTPEVGEEPSQVSLTPEERKEIEDQIRQEITSHPERYKKWDIESLIDTAIGYRFNKDYPYISNELAISMAMGQENPIAATAEPEKVGLSENARMGLLEALWARMPADENGNKHVSGPIWEKAELLLTGNPNLTYDQVAEAIYPEEEDETISAPGGITEWWTPEGIHQFWDERRGGYVSAGFDPTKIYREPTKEWYETGDLSQIRSIQPQGREPNEFDMLLSQGTPTWLKEFMSAQEYQQEQANTQAWQNYYSQIGSQNPANFVGQISPEELSGGKDAPGIGWNQQWAEDAYQGLINNLTMTGLRNITLCCY